MSRLPETWPYIVHVFMERLVTDELLRLKNRFISYVQETGETVEAYDLRHEDSADHCIHVTPRRS